MALLTEVIILWNIYTHMKTKCKKNYDDTVHFQYLMNVLLSMFEYKGLPETLPQWLIETMFITEGACGVCEIENKLYTGTGGFCGDVVNFMPVDYQITNIGIGTNRGKIGEVFAVGVNNSMKMPDLMLMQTASILTEIDVSERCNVQFSRFLRIPKVKDNKEKTAIESAVKAITDGRFESVISDNVLENVINGDTDNRFLDLVDVKEIDKLQYLNQYRDNIVKRFFQHYGQGMQTTAKLAQQTTDELHGNDSVSMIIVLDRLKCRRKFVEDINKLFGTDICVDFSECWKDQQSEMLELYNNGTPDHTPTEMENVYETENSDKNTD